MTTKKTLIQSLDRAFDILAIVRDSQGAVRATDIANQLSLGVATAHNLIRTLYVKGYLAQDENNRYLLGPECFKLYSAAGKNFAELRNVVSKPVQNLADESGDTTFFGCEYYGSLYCVSISTGGGQLVVAAKQEWLDKLHSTAAGKIIIAQKGIEWYKKVCKNNSPQMFTDKTITTAKAMDAEIAKIKKNGYALSDKECSDEVAAIGVAVYDKDNKFVGSLAQSIPSFYLESGKIILKDRVKLLNSYAEKISNGL